MKTKTLFICVAGLALASCAHSPVKAPCGAVKVASNAGSDCNPKPINLAENNYSQADLFNGL